MTTNRFVVLSYVGGPALLTNATSLLVLSTSNRFARAIDRARVLAERSDQAGAVLDELRDAHRRVDFIVRALTSFYFAAAMFALGPLATIAGAAISEIQNLPILNAVIGGAAKSVDLPAHFSIGHSAVNARSADGMECAHDSCRRTQD